MPSLLSLEEVSFTYTGKGLPGVPVLENINLDVRRGELVGILGPTGSGKSTLLQLFNGLLRPADGRVMIDGQDIHQKKGLSKSRYKVGLAFQFPETQLFEETVFADVAFGPQNLGTKEPETTKRVAGALESVGLDLHLMRDRSPFSLSGGEMRRVALAGVLAMEPALLALDEPTAGLDARGKLDLFKQLRQVHKSQGIAIVLVSHDVDELLSFVDRLVVLAEGKIIFDGRPGEVFADEALLDAVGLRVPDVTQLMQALRKRGLDVPVDIFNVPTAARVIRDALAGRENDRSW